MFWSQRRILRPHIPVEFPRNPLTQHSESPSGSTCTYDVRISAHDWSTVIFHYMNSSNTVYRNVLWSLHNSATLEMTAICICLITITAAKSDTALDFTSIWRWFPSFKLHLIECRPMIIKCIVMCKEGPGTHESIEAGITAGTNGFYEGLVYFWYLFIFQSNIIYYYGTIHILMGLWEIALDAS